MFHLCQCQNELSFQPCNFSAALRVWCRDMPRSQGVLRCCAMRDPTHFYLKCAYLRCIQLKRWDLYNYFCSSCLAGSQLQSILKREHCCLCSAGTAQADKSLIHTAPAPRNHYCASFNSHSRQALTQWSAGVSPLSLISQSGRSFQSLPQAECQGRAQPFAKMCGSAITPCFLLSEKDLGERRAVK